MTLGEAIAERRSARTFQPQPLSMAVLAQLLWAGQGVTSTDGKRTAPSAGGLYPLELYVVTPTELLHYLPDGHRAAIRATADVRSGLETAAFGQTSVRTAPDVIVLAAVVGRTRPKYGGRADAYVELEAGHAAQNILLVATALGLAAVPVGGIDPNLAASTLALPADETVIYLIPVGLP